MNNNMTNSISNNKQSYENIYNNLKEYMFYPDVIHRNMNIDHHNSLSINNKKTYDNNKLTKIVKEKQEDTSPFFIPQEKDKLFWCLYTFIHGEYEYKIAKNNRNTFTIEKKWKIDTLAKLKEKDVIDFLKTIKVKVTDLEDEFMNKEKLSLKGVQAFCFIYKLSVMYVSGRKYCEFLYKQGTSPELQQYSDIVDNSKTFVIINTPTKEDGINRNADDAYIKNVRDTYWKMENVNKPLKGVSAYSLSELQDICSKMTISLEDTETKKKKTMKVLYQELLSHF